MMQTEGSNQNTAAILTLVGGALAIAAGFLDWMKFDPASGLATTFSGTDLSAGNGTIGLGIGLIIFGIILLVRGKSTGGKGSSITVIVFAAIMLFAGGYNAISPGEALASFEADNVGEELGISEDLAKAAIQEGIRSKEIEVSALIGAWVATAAGVIGLLGGIAGVQASKKIRGQAGPAVAAPPPGSAPPPAS